MLKNYLKSLSFFRSSLSNSGTSPVQSSRIQSLSPTPHHSTSTSVTSGSSYSTSNLHSHYRVPRRSPSISRRTVGTAQSTSGKKMIFDDYVFISFVNLLLVLLLGNRPEPKMAQNVKGTQAGLHVVLFFMKNLIRIVISFGYIFVLLCVNIEEMFLSDEKGIKQELKSHFLRSPA